MTLSYAEDLPYFPRSERHRLGEDLWRGGSSPLATVCYEMEDPLSRAFVEAGAAAGIPGTQDVNGYQQEGFGPFDRNIDRGERASNPPSHAFINTSWASVRDALATHAIVTIVLPTDSGATMRIRKASTPESEHRELYRLLGVDENIMPPKTIWSETGDHE